MLHITPFLFKNYATQLKINPKIVFMRDVQTTKEVDYKEGKVLFNVCTSKRDYSGSPQDEYAQLLYTIHQHIGEDVFNLLKTAEKQNKILGIKQNHSEEHILQDEYTIEDIVLLSR